MERSTNSTIAVNWISKLFERKVIEDVMAVIVKHTQIVRLT